MNKAELGITRLRNQFTTDKGETVVYETLEIEIAPNLCANISLKPQNQRVLQKYNPDLYQLITNLPLGMQVVFSEKESTLQSTPQLEQQDNNATNFIAN